MQPGHVFPLIAQPGGVLVRAGHTEACCDLARLAGLTPVAVLCEVMKDDGTMARLPDLLEFCAGHQLKIGTIADLIEYRSRNESLVSRSFERDIDTAWGRLRLVAFHDLPTRATHLALVAGKPRADAETLVRVHEPLSIVDLLDAGPGTHSWSVGRGAVRDRQGRHRGDGADELPRNAGGARRAAGRDAARCARAAALDLRTYGIGAQILRELGVGRMRLMAAPRKMPSMAGFGLEVTGYVESPRR